MVSLGHAHPAVAEAVAEQARTLSHVSNLYGNTLAPEVARTIDRLINGGTGQAGGQVFFANSGAEANECALKLARRWAGGGRHVVISADNAFHGRTLATLTATGQPEKQAPFLPLPEGFVHVALRRRRRARQGARPRHRGRRAARAAPGRGRGRGPELGLPGRGAVAVHRAQRAAHARRGPDRPRPHRALVRLPGPGPRARRRDDGQGARATACRSGPAGPGPRWRPPSGRATTASTFGGQPLALAAVKATLAVMEAEDVLRPRPRAGARAGRRAGRAARGRLGARRGPAPGGTARGPGGQGGRGRGRSSAACWSTRSGPTPSGSRRRCWCATTRSTRRCASWARRWPSSLGASAGARCRRVARGSGRAQPLRHRRSRPGRLGPRARARPRRSRPPQRAGGPGRGAALREAVGTDAQLHRDGGGRPRRAPRVHPGRPRSASTSGRPPRTSPARWPATTASCAPGCSTTPCWCGWRPRWSGAGSTSRW